MAPTPGEPASAAPAPAEPASAAPASAIVQGVPAGSSKVFNPDTSIIGNFIAAGGKNPNGDAPSLSLAEAEIAFQAVVDPYARADFYLGASSEGLSIEEGFITFTTLPANLLLKVGKVKAQFGKANTLHSHQLPYIDTPLVLQNLVGGEEGLSDSGFSLSHLIQNPFLYLDVTGEVFAANSDVFQSPERSKLNYVGHVRAYRDLTEATNLDFGASFAFGPTDVNPADFGDPGSDRVLNKKMYAVDATFRYRPLRRAIYHRLNLRTELIWSRQDLPLGQQADAFGVYGLGEYQMNRRWYIGARFDRSGRALEPDLVDTGGSVFLTYWPSEFSQIRGQFRRTNYGDGIRANEFFLQFNFAIGAHGAHPF
ncbi:MAG: hypothetical protein R2752_10925 [Vicinamibacterales bacterium]